MKGTCGTCIWQVNITDGALVIGPADGKKGTLYLPEGERRWPWRKYGQDISRIVITDGVRAGRSIRGIFAGMKNCVHIDAGCLDTSEAEDMRGAFDGCKKLSDLSFIAGWDTKNVSDMSWMFSGCSSITDISPLADLNMASVRYIGHMFIACASLRDISVLGKWNTKTVRGMSSIFSNCTSLSDISPLESWNTESAESMDYMFNGCMLLFDISPLTKWDVGNAVDIISMFGKCPWLTDISPLAEWNIGNVKYMRSLFFGCSDLADISPLAEWNTKNVEEMSRIFYGCSSLSDADAVRNWDISSLRGCQEMFSGTRVEKNPLDEKIPMACPKTGAFTGYKKCRGGEVVTLRIPENARRSSALSRKCRCDRADVVMIVDKDGNEVSEAVSWTDPHFVYRKGETVSVSDFDTDRFNECSTGVHLFMTMEEAKRYRI